MQRNKEERPWRVAQGYPACNRGEMRQSGKPWADEKGHLPPDTIEARFQTVPI